MAELNYTKGDWRKIKDAQGTCMIMHPTEEGYALACLSDVFLPSKGYWYDKDWSEKYPDKKNERESNAQLISAAPDMYQALKDIKAQQSGSYSDKSCGHHFYCTCPWTAGDKALNKAEGKK